MIVAALLIMTGALIIFIPIANMIVSRHLKRQRKSKKKLNTKKAFRWKDL